MQSIRRNNRPPSPLRPPPLRPLQVACGSAHTLALTAGGEVGPAAGRI